MMFIEDQVVATEDVDDDILSHLQEDTVTF
jgi:hypothetical protein